MPNQEGAIGITNKNIMKKTMKILGLICLMASCGSKKVSQLTGNAKEDFMALHAEIEANEDSWTESDWENALETYEAIAEEVKEHATDLTYDEWEEVTRSLHESEMPERISDGFHSVKESIKGYAKAYKKEAKKKAEKEAEEEAKKNAKEAIEIVKEIKKNTDE